MEHSFDTGKGSGYVDVWEKRGSEAEVQGKSMPHVSRLSTDASNFFFLQPFDTLASTPSFPSFHDSL